MYNGYKVQVYNIVIHSFFKGYTPYSYKILAVFLVLYNKSL